MRTTGGTRRLVSSITMVAMWATLGVAQMGIGELPGATSWIVAVDPAVPAGDLATTADLLVGTAGGTVEHVYANVLHGFAVLATDLEAAALATLPEVAAVVPDGTVQLDDPPADADAVLHGAQITPTGVSRIDASASGATGAGITVAVVDSGIDPTHIDLAANLHPTLSANCDQPLLPQVDGNGHGTHVAGIIAAADDKKGIVGVAPSATLVPVQAFDATGGSTWAKVICGIDYVAAHSDEIDIVNFSFGDVRNGADTNCDGAITSDLDALHQAVCDLVATGVVVVAAAGNNAFDVDNFVPAMFPEVITVSALMDFDGQGGGAAGCLDSAIYTSLLCDDTFAWPFSNFGPRIDVMAPGFEILSTVPGGYGTKDGTSMAAPHVAGTVALMLQADPALTIDELRAALLATGECPDASAAGADGACDGQGSWGQDPDAEPEPLVDAAAAVAAVTPPPPPPPPTPAVHVGDLDSGASGKRNFWTASVSVLVHAGEGPKDGVDGAVVTFGVTDSAGTELGPLSCATNRKGTCSVSVNRLDYASPTDALTFTVLDVADAGYDAGQNHDDEGDSDGTTIVVLAP